MYKSLFAGAVLLAFFSSVFCGAKFVQADEENQEIVVPENTKPCLLKEKLIQKLHEIIERELNKIDEAVGTPMPPQKREELIQRMIAGTLIKLAETRHIAENADDCPSGEWGKTLRP